MIERPSAAIRPIAHTIAKRNRAIAARAAHPAAGFWRALPLAMAISAGWWAIGLAAVAALAHAR